MTVKKMPPSVCKTESGGEIPDIQEGVLRTFFISQEGEKVNE